MPWSICLKKIKEEAIYLFYTNEKHYKHNLQQLVSVNSMTNPTAIIKSIGTGNKGKAIASHFLNKAPGSTMLCLGAIVSSQGCIFQPLWGLHNGACSTVQEIIYDTDDNPNSGQQPKYVVTRFPHYISPTWNS